MRKRTDARDHPRLLLVEGDDDKRFVPEIIELGIGSGFRWERDGAPVVFVEPKGGVENILRPGTIAAEIRASDREALGVVVDADARPEERWQAIRNRLLTDISDLDPEFVPVDLPTVGFIVEVDRDAPHGPRRLGIWVMPDNRTKGMMETFARTLIADGPLHGLAEQICDDATRFGAPFKATHRDKAIIHTWLAWQDPPGRQLHTAVAQKMLDPSLPSGQAFIAWFRALFRV